MTLLDRGLQLRMERLSTKQLWDLADVLDVDPDRLPMTTDRASDERLGKRLRSAIRSDLRAEARASSEAALS